MRHSFLACMTLGASLTFGAAQNATLTAKLTPAKPVVGVTKVTIAGKSVAGHKIIITETFPDGSVHHFSAHTDAHGGYRDGPFVLQQLGVYHDSLKDETTGASVTLAYSGAGDFELAVAPAKVSLVAGSETKFTVTFKSIAGLDSWVLPQTLHLAEIQGAVGSWSVPAVKVPAGGSGSATFTLLTLFATPIGAYPLVFQGLDGAVSHRAAPVTLTVTDPPPNSISAAFHPDAPVVGVSESNITGTASKGVWITDLSTFPDGSTHSFQFKSNGVGAYVDGPFVLKELGTYHDVLVDSESGGRTTITYQGIGDFKATIDKPRRHITAGQKAEFLMTFTSLSGFFGNVVPSVDLSSLTQATATWSLPSVPVRPAAAGLVRLTINTTAATMPGAAIISAQGKNGSVVHAAPDILLTVDSR